LLKEPFNNRTTKHLNHQNAMTDNYKNMENEIEQTLHSLDGMSAAEPNPFFYTRLKARMEKELLTPRKVFGWQVKPIYAISTLSIILILNAITIFTASNQNSEKGIENVQQYNLYNPDGM
jgi:hypothetical protein